MPRTLTDLETSILHDIPTEGSVRPRAYAVWTDREGDVQMGPVRLRRVLPQSEGGGHAYECSPFPGAWDRHVPESAMVRVRHLGALSLSRMECVCQGTEWDTRCPAPTCTTPVQGWQD